VTCRARRGERHPSAATDRRRTQARRPGPMGTMRTPHDGHRGPPDASVADPDLPRPTSDHPPVASCRLPRVLAAPLTPSGSSADAESGPDSRDGIRQPALGSRADPRRASEAWDPREQAHRSALHDAETTPWRRTALVDLPEEPHHVVL